MATSQVVLGLGFGDEGKGRTVSYLCHNAPESLVVRFSGGQQCGHNVMLNEDEEHQHVFSNFGSGTLNGCHTYWSEFCTFDPIGVCNEHKVLVEKNRAPVLYVNTDAPITTPYEKRYGRMRDESLNHGTCGVGVGATWQREEQFYSIKVRDLYCPSVLKAKLELAKKNLYPYIDIDGEIDAFLEICRSVRNIIMPVKDIPTSYSNYIFEGSQGLMLDQHVGFFPHVTRTNTGLKNIYRIVLGTDIEEPEPILVTRAYLTRHGTGFMPHESWAHAIKENPHETNVSTTYQGEFRRTLLDLDMLQYAIDAHDIEASKATLVITCLDLLPRTEYNIKIDDRVMKYETEDEYIQTIDDRLWCSDIWISKSPYTQRMYTCRRLTRR